MPVLGSAMPLLTGRSTSLEIVFKLVEALYCRLFLNVYYHELQL